ncbi:TRAP transporter small permease [Isachenkonia alkalipeptolytica]|nr:TRAP transporter small permease [Isachenkonia alkalipeptolytica]
MKKFIRNFEEIVSGTFISITILIVISRVIMRYFFNTGFYWAEEVATYSFVWSVFIGASACYKHNMHIGIDLLTKVAPMKVKKYVRSFVNLMMLIINGYITLLSLTFVQESFGKPTPVLGISSAYVSSAVLVGFGLMTIHSLIFLVSNIKMVMKKEEVSKDLEQIESVDLK